MRRKIVAGNWKMNLNNQEAQQLTSEIVNMVRDEIKSNTLIIIAPPVIHMSQVGQLIKTGQKNILLAAQNCSSHPSGAYTGEISAAMIKSHKGSFVILGHSERRTHFYETNAEIARKVTLVFENDMEPVFCCGESKDERESGHHTDTVKRQIEEGLFHIQPSEIERVVIAYEPVWAIGTGLTATPGQAQDMHQYIRKLLERKYGQRARNISLLYGGSCNDQNAEELFSLPDIDGGLIGGASLKSRTFINIIKQLN